MGGSEIEAQRVCSALIQRGYQVEVLCGSDPPMHQQPRWTDDYGVPVRVLGIGWPTSRWRQRAYAAAVGWTLLRERKTYDLVYFLMQGLHLAVGLLVTRFLDKPAIVKISGSALIPLMQKSWLGRKELQWMRQWAKQVMILNDGMVEEARQAGLDVRQLLWMPNPVDVDTFSPASDPDRRHLREALALRGTTVVYVGRLAPEKELGSLIGGFSRVVAAFPDAQLVLVGDGPCRTELQSLAEKRGVANRVRFVGRASTKEVRQWLQAADIFALVSSIEGFSCSLTEAMAVGLPCLVSDIPGNAQLVEPGVQGLRFRLRDEESLAIGLSRLLADPALRTRLGAHGRRAIVENYSADKVVDRYERLFHQILS